MLCALLGVAIALAVGLVAPWQLALLCGWDVASCTLVASIWTAIVHLDATATERVAMREDDSRAAANFVVIFAGMASLAGVFAGIIKARRIHGAMSATLIVASLLAVVFAWLAVHTIFTLRYAHRYYDLGGGIDFPSDGRPSYRDFAYVSFTVGMTFQVSDTNITDPAIRWLLLRHAALAFVFATVIIALTINVLAGLLG